MCNFLRTTFFLLAAITVLTGCSDKAGNPQPTSGSSDCKPLTHKVTRLRDNKVIESSNFAYDASGNLTSFTSVDSVSNYTTNVIITYLGNNPIKIAVFSNNNQVERFDGTFNTQNQLTKMIHKDSSSRGITLDTINFDYSVTGRIKSSRRNAPGYVWELNANGLATTCYFSYIDARG